MWLQPDCVDFIGLCSSVDSTCGHSNLLTWCRAGHLANFNYEMRNLFSLSLCQNKILLIPTQVSQIHLVDKDSVPLAEFKWIGMESA
jgi:hypothetical protein